ncbi:DUF6529 family protein [Pseudonocardia zijingensis]|uniref:DUF6529 family protein n=1 Tax=Pseudonocardia zijingensis TaxID=153376 RepID=A0ABP4A2H4_9PSEU
MNAPDPELTRPRATARPVPPPAALSWTTVVLPVVAGTAVAVGLGVYGRLHAPAGLSLAVPGFSGTLYAKAWLTTLAFAFALVQIVTALALEGRVRLDVPVLPTVHRWSGRLAVLLTVPVAVHCLYSLGFRPDDPRVLAHSAVGCLVYGAFVAKMLILVRTGLPRWAVPAAGGLLFTAFVAVWLTSSWWVFTAVGFTF